MYPLKLALSCLPAAWYWVFILIQFFWRREARTNLAIGTFGTIAGIAAAFSPLTSLVALVTVWRSWHRLSEKDRIIAVCLVALSFAAGAHFWLGISLTMRGG
jgi:hypothetical protein